eukprot:gb/GECG01011051.1/.p1 GENE.gb/GECG01011051.1/~~gb/GECG01011051.1/.p1  ORF type:complete len:358 (+),score=33.11 gb/GECG01011051.1/:1-1074(+)
MLPGSLLRSRSTRWYSGCLWSMSLLVQQWPVRQHNLWQRALHDSRRTDMAVSGPRNPRNPKRQLVDTILKEWEIMFAEAGVSEPYLSAVYILGAGVDKKRHGHIGSSVEAIEQWAREHTPEDLSLEEWRTVEELKQRRLHHEPIQYLVGNWDFHELKDIELERGVLIPRPETESLVNLVLKSLREDMRSTESVDILDVGCGSGVIGLALAKSLLSDSSVGQRRVLVHCIDQDETACRLTAANARKQLPKMRNRYDKSFEFAVFQASAQDYSANCQRHPIYKHYNSNDQWNGVTPAAACYSVVVSNPPYLSAASMMDLGTQVTMYEDTEALDGKSFDGLLVARIILSSIHQLILQGMP